MAKHTLSLAKAKTDKQKNYQFLEVCDALLPDLLGASSLACQMLRRRLVCDLLLSRLLPRGLAEQHALPVVPAGLAHTLTLLRLTHSPERSTRKSVPEKFETLSTPPVPAAPASLNLWQQRNRLVKSLLQYQTDPLALASQGLYCVNLFVST